MGGFSIAMLNYQRVCPQKWPEFWIDSCIFLWLTGWLTPLKNDVVKVSWDDEIPNWMESHKLHVPNHQPVQYFIIWCCFQLVYRYIISWFIISFPVKLDVNWGQNTYAFVRVLVIGLSSSSMFPLWLVLYHTYWINHHSYYIQGGIPLWNRYLAL